MIIRRKYFNFFEIKGSALLKSASSFFIKKIYESSATIGPGKPVPIWNPLYASFPLK